MKKFNVVLLIVLVMAAAGFMGCISFTWTPLTDTEWLQYPNDAPTATIKLGTEYHSSLYDTGGMAGLGFHVLSIGKFDVPKHEKNRENWSSITVPANTELAIYGEYFTTDGGYPTYTEYTGKNTFKCPPLSEGKTYTLAASWMRTKYAEGKMMLGLCFILRDAETNQWIVQQMVESGVQIFND